MSTDNFGLTAEKIEPWVSSDIFCNDRTQQKVFRTGFKITARDADGKIIKDDAGNPILIDEEKILLQVSSVWTLTRKRKVIGVTKFKNQNGDVKVSFDLVTGPKTNISWLILNKKFLCTSDRVVTQNIIIGTAEQQQTWIHIGPWENIPEGKFK